ALVAQMDPFAGKYFSLEYMRRQILKQTDQEFQDIQKEMDAEIAAGKLVDPVKMQQLEVEQMEMSLIPPEPEPEEPSMTPQDYKKGEI
ncbi:MAG: portal protein, partial [Thermoproteota archaeon]|nr:portal protein [Thermoproteota archaeon]